jgi:RNA polymerase sigma-70 factor (ECF subfamily)
MEPAVIEYDLQRPVIEAIQAGDAHALAELMASQGRWVRGVVFGVVGRTGDLDDVCQKVWIKVWQESQGLKDVAVWRPWLYRIARNAAMDSLRAGQRRKRLHETSSDVEASGTTVKPGPAAPDHELVARETHEAMLAAIEALPPLYREPFVLKHVEEWSYAQIGEALGLPTDTVETRLVRARRLLRERLAGKV